MPESVNATSGGPARAVPRRARRRTAGACLRREPAPPAPYRGDLRGLPRSDVRARRRVASAPRGARAGRPARHRRPVAAARSDGARGVADRLSRGRRPGGRPHRHPRRRGAPGDRRHGRLDARLCRAHGRLPTARRALQRPLSRPARPFVSLPRRHRHVLPRLLRNLSRSRRHLWRLRRGERERRAGAPRRGGRRRDARGAAARSGRAGSRHMRTRPSRDGR